MPGFRYEFALHIPADSVAQSVQRILKAILQGRAGGDPAKIHPQADQRLGDLRADADQDALTTQELRRLHGAIR